TAEGDVAPGYKRHRPEKTLLYQIIEQHYPDFRSAMQAQDRPLPGYVQDEFEVFLQCGRLHVAGDELLKQVTELLLNQGARQRYLGTAGGR
ncbi:MAG: hypothetical protein GY807_24630, partial [Gammaproteobacteria bacterium]|nr:hypothetical protein [Gammaproteobacteria bacterium]